MTEPRKPGRPRKALDEPTYKVIETEPASPGPIQLELRSAMVGQQAKIVWGQRVYAYEINPQGDTVTITARLREA